MSVPETTIVYLTLWNHIASLGSSWGLVGPVHRVSEGGWVSWGLSPWFPHQAPFSGTHQP
jgi:hypothetical protein